jgi:hypothetical protein
MHDITVWVKLQKGFYKVNSLADKGNREHLYRPTKSNNNYVTAWLTLSKLAVIECDAVIGSYKSQAETATPRRDSDSGVCPEVSNSAFNGAYTTTTPPTLPEATP